MMGQKQVRPATSPQLTEATDDNEDNQVSSVLVTPRYSTQYMKILNDCLQQLIVFSSRPGETSVSRLFQTVIKQVVPQAYDPLEDILCKGDECSGIYFIMEGTVAVVTEDGENIIATLTAGQFFGEVSTFYRLPVTARVRAQSRCQCFVLDEEQVWSLLPDSGKSVDIIDWFVARKYIPTSSSLECQRIYRRMLLYSFEELPLFKGWSEESLKDLILALSTDSIVLYPPNSYIVCQGDPGHVFHILLRGRAVITGQSGLEVETTSIKFPIVFGEAGLFLDTQDQGVLDVKTVTECQVVTIRLDTILASLEEESNDCQDAWDRRKKLWQDYAEQQVSLDDIPDDVIQFEVIFQHLSNSSLFSNSTVTLLDHLVRESQILHIKDGELAYDAHDSKERTVLLILGGHLELVGRPGQTSSTLEHIQSVTQGQIIAKIPGMPAKATYKSIGESYVIKYSTSLLKQTLVKYSPKKKKRSS